MSEIRTSVDFRHLTVQFPNSLDFRHFYEMSKIRTQSLDFRHIGMSDIRPHKSFDFRQVQISAVRISDTFCIYTYVAHWLAIKSLFHVARVKSDISILHTILQNTAFL